MRPLVAADEPAAGLVGGIVGFMWAYQRQVARMDAYWATTDYSLR
jgi:hypothetical protein